MANKHTLYHISIGCNAEGDMKWISLFSSNKVHWVKDPEDAAVFSYSKAKEICSKSIEGWLAFPIDYVFAKIERVVKRKQISMNMGRGWRKYGQKTQRALNLEKEMRDPSKNSRRGAFKAKPKTAREVFGPDATIYSLDYSKRVPITEQERNTPIGVLQDITPVEQGESACDSCAYKEEDYFSAGCEFCIANCHENGIMHGRNFKSK